MRFVKLTILFLFCAVGPGACFADDGGVDIEGGAARLIQEHPSISMSDEYVLIQMIPDKYRVTARFNFFNAGPSTTVAVGFPAAGREYVKNRDFIYFKTWVNGELVQTSDVPEAKEGDWDTWYKYYKVKQVNFISNSTTTTIVDYEAPYGSSVGPISWLNYEYGTGKSWKGPIGKAVFDLRFNEELLGFKLDVSDNVSLTHRSRGQMVFEINNVKPVSYARFMLLFNPQTSCLSITERDRYSLNDYCSSIVGVPTSDSRPTPKVSVEQAKYPTLAVLRLRRNAIYAQHGRIFQDKDLKKFFSNMSWYAPQTSFKDSLLSADEIQKIKEINDIESDINSKKEFTAPFFVQPEDTPISFTIRSEKTSYEVGEDIVVIANFKNTSDKEVALRWYDQKTALISDKIGIVMAVVPLPVKGPTQRKSETIYIKPNEYAERTILISNSCRLPMTYKLTVAYRPFYNREVVFPHRFNTKAFTGELVSNIIPIKIVKKAAK